MQNLVRILLGVVFILVSLGLVMLASASSVQSAVNYGGAHYFVIRQIVWVLLALIAGIVVARLDSRLLYRLALPLWIFAMILLVLVRIPGIGHNINGSYRWLKFGPLTMQPSEFAKVSLILMLAWLISRNRRRLNEFRRGIMLPLICLALTAGMVLVEPDFGMAILFSFMGLLMMFAGGVHVGYLIVVALLGMSGGSVLIMQNPERMRRIMAFLSPTEHVRGEAWQLANSLCAFQNGGPFGVGLGQSIQKHFYLPEAHTDFIFAILAEELGLVGSLSTLLLFVVFLLCGVMIAIKIKYPFGRLVVAGVTFMISTQAAINLCVVTGCLPTKGIPLPFISYGGSSMVVGGALVGLIVSLVRHRGKNPAGQ